MFNIHIIINRYFSTFNSLSCYLLTLKININLLTINQKHITLFFKWLQINILMLKKLYNLLPIMEFKIIT